MNRSVVASASMWILRRLAMLRFVAGLTAGMMFLVGCGGLAEPDGDAAVTRASTVPKEVEPLDGVLSRGQGEVSHHGLTVRVGDSASVALSVPTFHDTTAEALWWLVGQGIAISPPMLVTTDAPGGTLIKEFPEPLPQGWDAGFMTVDEESGELAVIEGVLSADRRSMTAQVEHFSNWWDYLTPSEIGETMRVGRSATVRSAKELGGKAVDVLTEPAEKVDYFVGGVLATRVDPPTCSGAVPSWVQDTIFIETHFNNPIHFCTGSAPQDSDILEVKVRINRGFGMTVTTAAPPVSASNTTYSGIGDGVAAFAADVAQSMANGMGPLLEGGSFLGAGHEATLRFYESSVRLAGSGPLVTVNAPSTLTFAASSLASALTAAGLSQMDATSLAVAGVASCSADMMRVGSAGDAAFGTAKCGMTYLSDNADQLASATAGAVSSTALRRAYLVLTAAAASHNYVAYQLSRKMEEGGRTVTVITTPQLQPRQAALTMVSVPASCGEEERVVTQGELDHQNGGSGGTWLYDWDKPFEWQVNPTLRLRVVRMECTTMGGTNGPGALLFFDDAGQRVAELFATELVPHGWQPHIEVAAVQGSLPLLEATWHHVGGDPPIEGILKLAWDGAGVSVVP
jgi:hypothetical protein